MTEPSKMPARINVWGGPGSGWNDVTILNEVRTTRYIRADLAEQMAEALRGMIANACVAAEIQPDGIHRIDATESEWVAHVAATTKANAALSAWEASNG